MKQFPKKLCVQCGRGGDTIVNNADLSKVLVEHACLGNVRYNSITTTVYQGTNTASMCHTLVYVPIKST